MKIKKTLFILFQDIAKLLGLKEVLFLLCLEEESIPLSRFTLFVTPPPLSFPQKKSFPGGNPKKQTLTNN